MAPSDPEFSGTSDRLAGLCRRAAACRVCFDSEELAAAEVDVAQPRWVGTGYWTSRPRIILLLINPGSGKAHQSNAELRRLLQQFRSGRISLDSIFDFQRQDISSWGRGRFMSLYFDFLGLEIDKVGLANVAWCAERNDNYPDWMLSECFHRHTADLLRILKPDIVLLCGDKAQAFATKVRDVAPQVRILSTPHYAARLSNQEMQERLSRIRQELGSVDAVPKLSLRALPESEGKGIERRAQLQSDPGKRPSKDAATNRAAEIAHQLGMQWHTKVASGRYLQCKTAEPDIHIIVFHRYGRDCVGVEGVRRARQRVLGRLEEWQSIGLHQHQKTTASHKSAATFIAEFPPQADGSLDAVLHDVYRQLVLLLGESGD